ncbi:HEAT repeat domain-containing protein [Tautonia marina]|uniref:HEAT repeat domain-containing protein n=1 Tax=Tautonia marina TaxID=2653855 RepID=UPI001260AD85|nr:HEAT repeat domain-containing protein [Tautonia marina]
MLEGLDSIDWATLTHAYGEATDVPNLLRALLSPDSGERDEALDTLFGNIWHQGTVYPATAAAVPFLYELLQDADLPDPDGVALLLSSIATGRGYLDVHARDAFGEPLWQRILAKEGKSLDAEMEREAREIQSVRSAIAPGIPLLIPFLRSEHAEIRESIAEALAEYPEHARVSHSPLEDAVEDEADPEVRELLLEMLQRLRDRQS